MSTEAKLLADIERSAHQLQKSDMVKLGRSWRQVKVAMDVVQSQPTVAHIAPVFTPFHTEATGKLTEWGTRICDVMSSPQPEGSLL